VPLPHGNGEQALNAQPVVDAGGGAMVLDEDLNGDRVLAELVPWFADPRRIGLMGAAARASGHAGADEALADIVFKVVGQ
jgi:UDP-N-acetylglucosamine--N-acetylmuramyl-(pentapeptide) pyrophosphoryl-undecaprenol N-acetylglucosamine transferase